MYKSSIQYKKAKASIYFEAFAFFGGPVLGVIEAHTMWVTKALQQEAAFLAFVP
ncbi:hypothetical protein NLX67_13795 [Domibacillus sp. A3M-37]|uniref:hypothetical protein n=1 Tax=Domibacillus sp. A3M-37 TaxID=2962037 RepID=UPI0020B6C4DC|nr:hypothetical protein [Domibacillus sp. A3M-37]MCP3763456.1 hypothetical protein [Domibacillus sp. A3M-37]